MYYDSGFPRTLPASNSESGRMHHKSLVLVEACFEAVPVRLSIQHVVSDPPM